MQEARRRPVRKRALLMAGLVGGALTMVGAVVLVWGRLVRPELEPVRSVFGLVIEGLGVVAEAAVAWFIYLELTHSRHEGLKEATQGLYIEWWSSEMRDHRTALKWFLENKRKELVEAGSSMKDVPHDPYKESELKGSVVSLVHFFDRVGWLGAAGLIDVDYILGPMQHVMRRTWMAMADLILKERKIRSSTDRLDPVYNYDFEWLYLHTCESGGDQGDLMSRLYGDRRDPKSMKEDIVHDEIEFEK